MGNFNSNIEKVLYLTLIFYVLLIHIRDCHCYLYFIHGKSATKKVILIFTLGEYFKCLFENSFFIDVYLNESFADGDFFLSFKFQ